MRLQRGLQLLRIGQHRFAAGGRLGGVGAEKRARGGFDVVGQIIGLDAGVVGGEQRHFEHVGQLAQIARPAIGAQNVERVR